MSDISDLLERYHRLRAALETIIDSTPTSGRVYVRRRCDDDSDDVNKTDVYDLFDAATNHAVARDVRGDVVLGLSMTPTLYRPMLLATLEIMRLHWPRTLDDKCSVCVTRWPCETLSTVLYL